MSILFVTLFSVFYFTRAFEQGDFSPFLKLAPYKCIIIIIIIITISSSSSSIIIVIIIIIIIIVVVVIIIIIILSLLLLLLSLLLLLLYYQKGGHFAGIFKLIFLNNNYCILIPEVCSQESNWQIGFLGPDHDLVSNRRRAVIWTNDGLIYLRIHMHHL